MYFLCCKTIFHKKPFQCEKPHSAAFFYRLTGVAISCIQKVKITEPVSGQPHLSQQFQRSLIIPWC